MSKRQTSEDSHSQASAIRQILASRPDPLGVLTTTARVVETARSVKMDWERIESLARTLGQREFVVPAWNNEHHFKGGIPTTVNYLFLLDALNFCFWGEPKWTVDYQGKRLDGYWALAASLKRAVEEDPRVIDADYLASISPADLMHVFRGKGMIPLFVDRWRNARELGRLLRDHFEGEALQIVLSAGRDAPRLAWMIQENLEYFQDSTVYAGQVVHFFKRAQILVADISGAFGARGPGEFTNLSELTAFADYKLPQLLRAWGALKYSPALSRRVDNQVELRKDSPEEIEIRSATLWVVEALRDRLAKAGRNLSSVQVDWFLWETSQGNIEGMKPYHHVSTIYY